MAKSRTTSRKKSRKTAKARRAPARKRKSAKPAARRAKTKAPARKVARKRARKAKAPEGIGTRIAHAVDAVLGTLTEAERLHTQTTRKGGFQELE